MRVRLIILQIYITKFTEIADQRKSGDKGFFSQNIEVISQEVFRKFFMILKKIFRTLKKFHKIEEIFKDINLSGD